MRPQLVPLVFMLVACGSDPDDASVDDEPDESFVTFGVSDPSAPEPDEPPSRSHRGSSEERRAYRPLPAVVGGTLMRTDDGKHLVASDPDRDLIHIFDLQLREEVATIELAFGAEPGRVVEGEDETVYVALRRAGKVIAIDLQSATIAEEYVACHNPRGLAFDDATGNVLVTCVERVIATIEPDGTVTRRNVAIEPRDIVATSPLQVSAFRAPGVWNLDAEGVLGAVTSVPSMIDSFSEVEYRAVAATRTVAMSQGWLMLHRLGTQEPLTVGPAGYYGPGPCGIPSAAAISQFANGDLRTNAVAGLQLVDLAASDDGKELTVVGMTAQGEGHYARLAGVPDDPGCTPIPSVPSGGDPVAVVYGEERTLWVQSREPAELYRIGEGGDWQSFALKGKSVADVGHELFHRPTSGGVACVSCHPEGRDDGFSFIFAELGPRRTQALNVDLEGTEPFHWAGDLRDMDTLISEVHGNRMSGPQLSGGEQRELARFIFELPRDLPTRSAEHPAAVRGAALFGAVGCGACHSGPTLTNNETVMIDGAPLQVPTLIGAQYRLPLMHDGRSADLRAAVLDMLPLSEPGGELDADQLEDVVAYLETL